MQVTLRSSAFRHGVSTDRILYVVEHCALPLYSIDEDAQQDWVKMRRRYWPTYRRMLQSLTAP